MLCFQHGLTALFALTAGRGRELSVKGAVCLLGLRCNFAALHEITDQRGLTSQILPADSTQIYFCLFLIEIVSLARVGLNLVVPGQVAVLQEERNSLLAENDVLTDRANQLDTFDDPSTPSGRKHSQLQQHFEALQEENFRSVAS